MPFRIHNEMMLLAQRRFVPATPPCANQSASKPLSTDIPQVRIVQCIWNSRAERPYELHPYECCGPQMHGPPRTFRTAEETKSWFPRMRLFFEAMGENPCPQLYSISIEPVDPRTLQTLYYKRALRDPSIMNVPAEDLAFGVDLCDEASDPSERNELPVIRGLLKPWSTFAPRNYRAEVDPDCLPPWISQHAIRSEADIDDAIADIFPDTFRARMKRILERFMEDIHAASLYTVTVQPYETLQTPLKKKHFMKVIP